MPIEDFFRFSSTLFSSTVQAHPFGLSLAGDKDVPNALMLVEGNYASISFPVYFKHYSGRVFRDVVDTGSAGLYLISNRMKSVLEENKLSGWQSFPIRLLDKKENEIQGYSGLSIIGRCGPIDMSKSEVSERRLVPHGPLCKYYKGLHVGLDKWDGSDFFLPERNYGTIITAKVAEIVKVTKLTNIRLTNLADVEISEGIANVIKLKQ